MKIAMLGNPPRPLHDPLHRGIERFSQSLAAKLIEKGHDVVMFSNDVCEPPCENRPLFDKSESANFRRLQNNQKQNSQELAKIKRKAYMKALKVIASENFDFIHNNSLETLPLMASSKMSTLMLTTLHCAPLPEQVYLFENMGERVSSFFCANSEYIKDLWNSAVPDLDIPVINNGVLDLAKIVDLNLSTQGKKGIWVGPIRRDSGLKKAIQACHLAGTNLIFSGNIDDLDYYTTEIQPIMEKGDEYLGHLDKDELKPHMEHSRFGVITNDYCFNTVLEMLANGVPIAGFRYKELEEVIDANNGFLTNSNKTEKLAQSIFGLKELCKIRIQQEAIRKWNIDSMASKYERVYKFLKVLHDRDRKQKAYWYLYSSSKQSTLA